MTDIAISINGLSKQYHIGGPQVVHDRLGDQVFDAITAPFRRAGKLLRGQATGASELDQTFWALNDVSFDVKYGEVVGVIGRNGAGKSTLLKVLSRITEPTRGEAFINGRVGSLLEVGTGFHPELTGRENVFLNGAILGMNRREISQKFDEIVDFAEIEQFIDTPVKHYSSGMYVRLAFAVAAHLEPEILIVDEVLAVGDMAFQKKCLGKMGDVSKQGRTVLFVSHNMGIMQSLCQRGIFLQNGRVIADCSISEAVNAYLNSLEKANVKDISTRTDRQGRGKVRLTKVEILDSGNIVSNILTTGQPARFKFCVSSLVKGMSCLFDIFDHLGNPVAKFQTDYVGDEDEFCEANGLTFTCEIDELLLMPGRYRINVLIRGDGEWQDFLEGASIFDVEEGTIRGRPIPAHKVNRANVSLPHRWKSPALS